MELLDEQGRIDLLYITKKELEIPVNKSKTGKKSFQKIEEIKKRWKGYVEDLYDKDGKPTLEQFYLKEEKNYEINE